MIFFTWIKYQYDKAISGAPGKQLIFLFCIIAFWFTTLLSVSFAFNKQSKEDITPQATEQNKVISKQNNNDAFNSEMDNHFWGIFSHFIDPGNIHMANKDKRWYAAIVAIIGAIFFNGVLISTLSNMIERRVDRINAGQVRYKLKNHIIIAGFDDYIIGIIKKSTEYHPCRKILIQTPEHPERLRNRLNILLTRKQQNKVIYYQSNRDTASDIGDLNPHAAASIYIIGKNGEKERDIKNLYCLKLLQNNLIKKCLKTEENKNNLPVQVYLNINDLVFYDVVKDYDIENKHLLNLRLVNFYEEWGRKIFADPNNINPKAKMDITPIPVESFKINSKKYLELVIVGFGQMGESIVRNAIRLLHFPNHSTTKITIIDKNADELFQEFKNNYPGFSSLYDMEFKVINDNFFSDKVINYISSLYKNPNALPYYLVTFNDTTRALKVGLSFPPEVYAKESPVIIRQESFDGANLIHKIKIPGEKITDQPLNNQYSNICFFGMIDKPLMAFEDFSKRENLAQLAQQTYLQTLEKMTWLDNDKPASKPYVQLNEVFKWSNRYLADSYIIKLKGLGYQLAEKDEFENKQYIKSPLSPETIKHLAEAEHARWVGERIMSGWAYADSRQDKFKLHPNIVNWETLIKTESSTIKYDEQFIIQMVTDLQISKYQLTKV